MKFVKKGVANLVIAVPEPTKSSEYAATELRYYLGMMTGVPFKILFGDEAAAPDIPAIVLRQVADETCGDDGFTVDSTSKTGRIEIRGGVRGVIYGMYELLEHFGCRFFTPLDEKIPFFRANLNVPDWHTKQKPVFEYRFHDTRDFTRFTRFAVKQRINGGNISDDFGGSIRYAWFVHSMNQMIPVAEFGKTHPEYFAMRDGKRYVPENPGWTQRCLTNPDVLKIAIERVRATLKAHPECRIISISQLDNGANCTCPECRKSDLEEGSPAGTMLKFVNGIATALKDEFPNVIFDTLAYMYTRPVCTRTKPAENVCVRLCSIECCFSHPMEQRCDPSRAVEHPDGTKSDFLTDLENWGKVCNRMYIWDYVTCFSHYPTPHPNWHTLQPNMQTFARNNVKGVFEQGNSKLGSGPDLVELRQYLIAKLLWNPDCDLKKHMDEFLNYYYGGAAPLIRKYIETLCKKCENDNIHVGFNDAPVQDFVSEKMLDTYDRILCRAEIEVYGDALRMMRVQKIKMCTWYLRLKRRAMLEHAINPVELNAFFTMWRAFGFTRIHEWVSAETAHRAFLEGEWRGESLCEHWTSEGPERL